MKKTATDNQSPAKPGAFFHKFLYVLSACALLFYLAGAFFGYNLRLNLKDMLLPLVIVCIGFWAGIRNEEFFRQPLAFVKNHPKEILFTALFQVFTGCVFRFTWISGWARAGAVDKLAKLVHLPKAALLLALIGVLAAVSGWFVFSVVCAITGSGKKAAQAAPINAHKGGWKVLLVCFVTALGTITVCSRSSFLYPLNDWVDANCFFTVGKSMMNGLVVYRDLFEQKGPYLYFVHGLAWLISHDSFFGIYLLEIAACTFFLYYSYKTVQLLMPADWAILTVPVSALLIYTTIPFQYGDSVEELVAPFLAYTLWVSLKAMKAGTDISRKEYFTVGILSGIVFWSKFTLVGFFIGWFLMPAAAYIRSKRWKELLGAVLAVAAGVALTTVPLVIYFGVHGAIGDWLKVYLLDNIFHYSKVPGGSRLVGNLSLGLCNLHLSGNLFYYACLLGPVYLLGRQGGKVAAHWALTVLFTFIFAFIGGVSIVYYCFVFCVFVPLAVNAFLHTVIKPSFQWSKALKMGAVCISVLACVALAARLTPNRKVMGVDKSQLPQYQFNEIISQEEDPSLLNFGFLDGGFYTVSQIVPNCKAFCLLNIPLEEMEQIHVEYAREGLCDFIVTRNRELPFDNYECVATSEYDLEGELWTYYLYKLR